MIVRVPTYAQLSKAAPDIWRGFPDIKGARVFVKPNLVCPPTRFDSASTTRPEVLDFALRRIADGEPEAILVGDCGFKGQTEATLRLSGYLDVCKKYGAEYVPLQDGPNFHKYTLVRLKNYKSLFGAKISDYVLGCDVVINLPKLKIHSNAGMTGAIKNMMGVIANKGSMHPGNSVDILHKRLHDFYFLMRGRIGFCLVDGVVGSEYAEQTGVPKKAGVLISGVDPWEVDCESSAVMGLSPEAVLYLKYIRVTLRAEFPVVAPEYIVPFERALAHKGARRIFACSGAR